MSHWCSSENYPQLARSPPRDRLRPRSAHRRTPPQSVGNRLRERLRLVVATSHLIPYLAAFRRDRATEMPIRPSNVTVRRSLAAFSPAPRATSRPGAPMRADDRELLRARMLLISGRWRRVGRAGWWDEGTPLVSAGGSLGGPRRAWCQTQAESAPPRMLVPMIPGKLAGH